MVRVLAVVLALILTGPAAAWETQVDDAGPSRWRSLYQLPPVSPAAAALLRKRLNTDEHTRLSDMALERLGVAPLFARGGSATQVFVDLNASWFRFDLLDGLPTVGDDPETILEERLMPVPALFAGTPDYSFTIYDWLNKNQLCPPGPRDVIGANCHDYILGWLGDLNATHFGSHAAKMYKRYHLIALDLARRAAALRQQLKQQGDPVWLAHKETVKEMELEALAYESFAQHFLQDRWAIGHMWERWNAGDYENVPIKDSRRNTVASGFAGIIHGAESVLAGERQISVDPTYTELGIAVYEFVRSDVDPLHIALPDSGTVRGTIDALQEPFKLGNFALQADPMSSPLVRDGRAVPQLWRHRTGPDRTPRPGMGDDRLSDILDKRFGKDYVYYDPVTGKMVVLDDMPVNVTTQFETMMTCSMAGYSEVIRAFGREGGGYGAWEAPLANDPGFDVLGRETCWDIWATNEAMYNALIRNTFVPIEATASGVGALETGRSLTSVQIVESLAAYWTQTPFPPLPGDAIAGVIERLSAAYDTDPMGTGMARGGIGSFYGFETGDRYPLTEYAEEADLSGLPATSGTGRDRETLFGFFNRAHSDYWCNETKFLFEALRDSPDERKQAVCEYFADFAWDGTDPDYEGPQTEVRRHNGAEVTSICTARGMPLGSLPDYPQYLDQGYVPHGDKGAPGDRSDRGYSTRSVANWCARVPIIDLSPDRALARENVVLEVDKEEERINVSGRDFGPDRGTLFARDGGALAEIGTIAAWREDMIEVDADLGPFEAGRDYALLLRRPDGVESEGLFRLRIKEKPDVALAPVVTRPVRNWPCALNWEPDALPPAVDFSATVGHWSEIGPGLLEEMRDKHASFVAAAAAAMEEAAACIDERLMPAVTRFYNPQKTEEHFYPEGPRYEAAKLYRDMGDYLVPIYHGTLLGEIESLGEVAYVVPLIADDVYAASAANLRGSAGVLRGQPDWITRRAEDMRATQDRLAAALAADDHKAAETAQRTLDHQKESVYERLRMDLRVARAYAAYLGEALTQWAVAAEALDKTILPALQEMRLQRLALIENQQDGHCGVMFVPEFVHAPVETAAAGGAIHPIGIILTIANDYKMPDWGVNNAAAAYINRFTLDYGNWHWGAAAYYDGVAKPSGTAAFRAGAPARGEGEGCAFKDATYDRLRSLARPEAVFGATAAALLKEPFAAGTQAPPDWVDGTDEDFTCRRCQGISGVASRIEQLLPPSAGAGPVTPYVRRLQDRQEALWTMHEECRRICKPPAVAGTMALPFWDVGLAQTIEQMRTATPGGMLPGRAVPMPVPGPIPGTGPLPVPQPGPAPQPGPVPAPLPLPSGDPAADPLQDGASGPD